MCRRRHDHRHRINFREELVQRRQHAHAQLFRHVGGPCGILIDKTCKSITREVAQNADMMHAESAGAHDADTRRGGSAVRATIGRRNHLESDSALTGFDKGEEMPNLRHVGDFGARAFDAL